MSDRDQVQDQNGSPEGELAVWPARTSASWPEVLRTLSEAAADGGRNAAGDLIIVARFAPNGHGTRYVPEPRRKEKAISAGLMRALGECADGNRNTASDLFIVARYVPSGKSYEVKSFTDEQLARAFAQQKNDESLAAGGDADAYGCFGPYHTSDGVKRKRKITRVRLEVAPTQEVENGDGPAGGPPPVSLDFPGEQFDALFYSLSALQKFAIPYYARLHGAAYAEKIEQEFLQDDLLLMGHLPNSEEEQIPPGGGGGDGAQADGAPPVPPKKESLISVYRITGEGPPVEYQLEAPAPLGEAPPPA